MVSRLLRSCSALVMLCAAACRSEGALDDSPGRPALPTASAPSPVVASPSSVEAPAPLASAVVEFRKELESSKLELAPRSLHEPKLAFGRGAIGQLTSAALVVFDLRDFKVVLRESLEKPRAVLSLADGGLLAFGAEQLLLWQPGWKHAKTLQRPTLLPGIELFADAQRSDRFWVFDRRGAELAAYRLEPGSSSLLLPDEVFELESPRGGVVGLSREAVWLYLTPGRVERRAPNGKRLSIGPFPEVSLPTWILPASRLEDAWFLDVSGRLGRWRVAGAPSQLQTLDLGARVLAAEFGRDARLFAAILVRRPGPRFELDVRGPDLAPIARVPLPSDSPSGADDWVEIVTRNQQLSVAQHQDRVAVGGPDRLLVFDGRGRQLFSSSSQ